MVARTGVKSRCVFCGEKLYISNVEHVVPQWAMKDTGTGGRSRTFHGQRWLGGSLKAFKLPWRKVHMPAHKACNDDHSDFENDAKKAVDAVQAGKPVTPKQLEHLADWLDKVRVGVWWWMVAQAGNPLGVHMTFGIKNRVGQKDRLFRVTLLEDAPKGMNLLGVGSLAFQFQPSVFCLRYNRLLLLSISSDFMLGQRMGFPYPEKLRQHSPGVLDVTLIEGTGRPTLPLFPPLMGVPGTTVYQSISVMGRSPLLTVDKNTVVPLDEAIVVGEHNKGLGLAEACALLECETRHYQSDLILSAIAMGIIAPSDTTNLVLSENEQAISSWEKRYSDRTP